MEGYEFFSDGDTEVILKCYKRYGEDMLNHLDGVFSFVIYDRNSREFFCARDRLGIKPFYYTYTNDAFAFSSNTKGASVFPKFDCHCCAEYGDPASERDVTNLTLYS